MPDTPFPSIPAGARVRVEAGKLVVPDRPIIPFVEGDGIGPDIWSATRRVLDAAVEKAYRKSKGIVWYEVFAGEKAHAMFGEWLPEGTVAAVRIRIGGTVRPGKAGRRGMEVAMTP